MAAPNSPSDSMPKFTLANAVPLIEQFAALLTSASNTDDTSSSRSQKIQIAQSLLETVDLGSRRPQLLELLAGCCYDQYMAVNDWTVLESAIEYYGELIEDTDENDLVNSARLSEAYARCMLERFKRGRNKKDLEQAVYFATESVERTKRIVNINVSLLIERLGTLWSCLFATVLSLDNSEAEDFNKMMKTAEEAEILAQGHSVEVTKRIETKSNLGLAYQLKWDQQGDFESLIKSLTLGQDVLQQLPEDVDINARVVALSNLSFRLQRAYRCYIVENKVPEGTKPSEGEKLLDDAVNYLAESVSLCGERLLSSPEDTLSFVMYIREFPIQHRGYILGKCAGVLRLSVNAIKDFCSVSSPNDQKDCVSTFYGLARYAAAAALQAGEPPHQALLLLEEGRTIVASLRQEVINIDLIRSYDDSLANDYSQALESFRISLTGQASFHERRSYTQRLTELRKRIEQIPGASQVLEQLSEEMILKIAQDRDVVVINVTDILSDAIIITEAGFRVVHLPNLDESQLSEDSWEVQTRLAQEENQEEIFHDLHTKMSKLLRDLWKNLVKPVLEDLGHNRTLSRTDIWPQIIWIPTGILCYYPIHAAGLGLHKEANAMNKVISSYAPSVSQLFRLREREKNGEDLTGTTKVSVISMPETVNRPSLDLSQDEAATIARSFPDAEILTTPSTEDVLAAIARQPQIVHFSCHGEVNYDQPLLSKLLTKDWQTNPLTVAQLQILDVEKSRLAFLSACFTANAGVENMQDEGNHLAGALHLAGFPNVVGSSWNVGEAAALDITNRFYEELAKGKGISSKEVAKALHFAVMDFRETTRTAGNRLRGDPVTWASFLHFGG